MVEDGRYVLRRNGEGWIVEFDGCLMALKDRRGVSLLGVVLVSPGRFFHGSELARSLRNTGQGQDLDEDDDLGTVLDQAAIDAYGARLKEIAEEIDEAKALGRTLEVERLLAEREAILQQLSQGLGLLGKLRRFPTRARKDAAAARRAILRTFDAIRPVSFDLYRFLVARVRLDGPWVAYLPQPGDLVWEVRPW